MANPIIIIVCVIFILSILLLMLRAFLSSYLLNLRGFSTNDIGKVHNRAWTMLAEDLHKARKMWFREYAGALQEIIETDQLSGDSNNIEQESDILTTEFNRDIEIPIMAFQFIHLSEMFSVIHSRQESDSEIFMNMLKAKSLASSQEYSTFVDCIERYTDTEHLNDNFGKLVGDIDSIIGNEKYSRALEPYAMELIFKTRITLSHYYKDPDCIKKVQQERARFFCQK